MFLERCPRLEGNYGWSVWAPNNPAVRRIDVYSLQGRKKEQTNEVLPQKPSYWTQLFEKFPMEIILHDQRNQ